MALWLAAAIMVDLTGCRREEPARLPNPATLADDPADLARFQALNREVEALGRFSNTHVQQLRDLNSRFPRDQLLCRRLEEALRSRSDWLALIKLLTGADPDNTDEALKKRLAGYYVEAHQFELARQLIDSLLEEEPDNVDLVWLGARSEFHMGDYPAAAKRLDRAYDRLLAMGNVDAMFLRGMIYFQLRDLANAESVLRKTVEAAPGHASANQALARVLTALDREDEATAYLEAARTIHERFNREERAQLERLNLWQEVGNTCANGDAEVCASALRAAIPAFDGPARQMLEQRLTSLLQAKRAKPTGRID